MWQVNLMQSRMSTAVRHNNRVYNSAITPTLSKCYKINTHRGGHKRDAFRELKVLKVYETINASSEMYTTRDGMPVLRKIFTRTSP